MIEPQDYYKQERVYSKKGTGMWRVSAFCSVPSVTMINLDTEETMNFGVGALTDKSFKALDGLVYDHKTASVRTKQSTI